MDALASRIGAYSIAGDDAAEAAAQARSEARMAEGSRLLSKVRHTQSSANGPAPTSLRRPPRYLDLRPLC